MCTHSITFLACALSYLVHIFLNANLSCSVTHSVKPATSKHIYPIQGIYCVYLHIHSQNTTICWSYMRTDERKERFFINALQRRERHSNLHCKGPFARKWYYFRYFSFLGSIPKSHIIEFTCDVPVTVRSSESFPGRVVASVTSRGGVCLPAWSCQPITTCGCCVMKTSAICWICV